LENAKRSSKEFKVGTLDEDGTYICGLLNCYGDIIIEPKYFTLDSVDIDEVAGVLNEGHNLVVENYKIVDNKAILINRRVSEIHAY
jgi:hypothetical protein